MKNKKGFISLVLLLIFSLSMVTAYAGEAETRPIRNIDNQGLTFEERIDLRIEKLQERMDEFLATRTASYEEKTLKALESSTKKLAFVSEFAPDLLVEYDIALQEHLDVHQLLYNTTYANQEAYGIETIVGIEELKIIVLAAIEDETMTPQDASIALKTYLTTRHDEYKSIKDAYQAEIEPLKEVNEANKSIVQELKQELRIAVEAGDSESIQNILGELLTWSSVHLDFDYAKLDILATY